MRNMQTPQTPISNIVSSTNIVAQANPSAKANPVKPTIVVLGEKGVGKSTFLNRLAGQDALFLPGRLVQKESLKPAFHEMTNFNLIDTPGVNDNRIHWMSTFNESDITKTQPIALVVLLFKAHNRPSLTDMNIVRIWKSVFENINAQNHALIFTHCD